MTQYDQIFNHLKRHRTATVRDLLAYTNYVSRRIFEMTDGGGRIIMFGGDRWRGRPYRIVREETVRAGKKVRLYRMVRGRATHARNLQCNTR